MTLAEVKAVLGSTDARFALPDAAIQLAYDAAEADVVRVAGGFDQLGVQYDNIHLRTTLRAIDETNWMDPVDTTGDRTLTKGYMPSYNPVVLQSVSWNPDGGDGTIAAVSLAFAFGDGSTEGLDLASQLQGQSLYLIHKAKLFEMTQDGLSVSGNTATYDRPDGDIMGLSMQSLFTGINRGDPIGLVVASAGAYVPQYSTGGQAIMRQASIELVKLKLSFDALASFRDGTYNQTQANYLLERERILQTVRAQYQ